MMQNDKQKGPQVNGSTSGERKPQAASSKPGNNLRGVELLFGLRWLLAACGFLDTPGFCR
jgi:hypothetical protein